MLNLNHIADDNSRVPPLIKIINMRDPEIYLAENIADYKEHAQNLTFPWYKKKAR
jgi:hypothetical protein